MKENLEFGTDDIGDLRTCCYIYVNEENSTLEARYCTMGSDEITRKLCDLDFSKDPLELLDDIESRDSFYVDEAFEDYYKEQLYFNETIEIVEDDEETEDNIFKATRISVEELEHYVNSCYNEHLREMLDVGELRELYRSVKNVARIKKGENFPYKCKV